MMAAVVAGRARAWMLMLRFAQPWVAGLELGVAGAGVSDWIRGVWGGKRTSWVGIGSAISMSAGAGVPFARGVGSGSASCCAGMGEGSAIVSLFGCGCDLESVDASRMCWEVL